MYTLAAVTTTISPVCPKCGLVDKSGKISCCGRGGSWFKKCKSAGNSNVERTWFEGIRACKTRVRSKTAIGQRLSAAQQLNSSHNAGMSNPTAFITLAKTPSTPMPVTMPIITSEAYGAVMANSKSISGFTSTIVSKSINMLTPTQHIEHAATLTTANASMINVPMSAPAHTPAGTSITARGCEKLSSSVVHITLLIIVTFYQLIH